MNQPHVTGLIAGPLVPFDREIRIDENAYRSQISRQNRVKGLGGIYVNGFVGEVYSLTPKERQLVIRLAREQASNNIPIISGIVGFTPDDLVQSAKEAQEAGADMVMVFPPYDNRFYKRLADRPDPPFQLFKELSERIDLPMWVFKFPKESGVCYSNETMLKIADEISSVVGTKASAISCSEYYELWSTLKGRISVFATGHDTPDLLGMMMLGSDGGMAGIMNIGEERWAEFIGACLNHEWGKARDLFVERLVPISEYIYGSRQKTRVGSTTSQIKECLVQMGLFPTSFVHPPDTCVTQEEKRGITNLLESLDLISEQSVHRR